MAAAGFDDRSNCGGQYYYQYNLESIIRLWLAELPWRCNWRPDGGTRLGVVEASGSEIVILSPDMINKYVDIVLDFVQSEAGQQAMTMLKSALLYFL